MPIKSYRPTTPTRRFQTIVSREDITKQRPEKSLVESKNGTGGRNSRGRVTSRFIGGGASGSVRWPQSGQLLKLTVHRPILVVTQGRMLGRRFGQTKRRTEKSFGRFGKR